MYALITGATSGIGKALAYEFAQAGYPLILVGRDEKALVGLQKQIRLEYQVQVKACKVDLCDQKARLRLIRWLQKEKIRLQFLINSAGIGQFGSFESYDYIQDQKMLQTNIEALTHLTKELIPCMITRSKILQIASTAAFAPGPYMAVYYASKAYVVSLGLALREELAPIGIGVSVLCPGPTQTPFTRKAQMKKADFAKKWAMTPEQVAKAAYQGLVKDKAVIIPGKSNYIAMLVMRNCPMIIAAKIVSLTQKRG
ncbi:MAG: SDR family NAD(P)-dependent oxidoreductase [Cellulosilyticaceae bacterium]